MDNKHIITRIKELAGETVANRIANEYAGHQIYISRDQAVLSQCLDLAFSGESADRESLLNPPAPALAESQD